MSVFAGFTLACEYLTVGSYGTVLGVRGGRVACTGILPQSVVSQIFFILPWCLFLGFFFVVGGRLLVPGDTHFRFVDRDCDGGSHLLRYYCFCLSDLFVRAFNIFFTAHSQRLYVFEYGSVHYISYCPDEYAESVTPLVAESVPAPSTIELGAISIGAVF